MSASCSHNAHSCLSAGLYRFLLLISFSLIALLCFMVYLFGTKSIESFQLRLLREDAVYMLLCKYWTKSSMWEHQAWCWGQTHQRVICRTSVPRGQSLLPVTSSSSNWVQQQDCSCGRDRNFQPGLPWGTAGWEMQELTSSVQVKKGRSTAGSAEALAPGEAGAALVQSSPCALVRPVRAHGAVLGNMPHESLCRGWKNVTTYGAEFEERIENKRHDWSMFLPLQLFACATDAWYRPPCSLGRYLEVVSGALALQKSFTNSDEEWILCWPE